MNINNKRQLESSMSIPIYEGSMLSIRTQSSNTNSLLNKSNKIPKDGLEGLGIPFKFENINWKGGKLDPEFLCAYCNTYLKFPVKFQECNHRVCSSCLADLLKHTNICPTCNISFEREQVIIDNEFQRSLQNLEVYCIHESTGCNWEGIFKDLMVHLDECEYTLVTCSRGCGIKYLRKNEKEHRDDDCLKNETQCEFCETILEKEKEIDHLNHCLEFLVPCPNNCGVVEIKRKLIENHLDNECPKQEILCPFEDSGCTFKSVRTEMAKHMKESPGIHLNLLCKTVTLQKQQIQIISEVIEKKNKEINDANIRINFLEKLFGPQFIWKIDNYKDKLNESKSGKKSTLFSPNFFTSRHGYKLGLSTALYGDGKAKGKYMSLYVCICKGEFDALLQWPFNHKIILTLLDQAKNITEQRSLSYTIKPNTCKENLAFLGRPINDRNISFGAQKFVELEVMNSFEYIAEDTIFIKVEVIFENQ